MPDGYLPPSAYYAEPLSVAQMRGAQLGQMRRSRELQEAQMLGEMQAYGVTSPRELMMKKATMTRETAERQAQAKRFEDFGNVMQDWEEMDPTMREAALKDEGMRGFISGFVDPDSLSLEKEGTRFRATTAFPGRIMTARGDMTEGYTRPDQEYISVKTPQGDYFREVVGTRKLAGKPVKEADTAKILKRQSAIQAAKTRLEQTGGLGLENIAALSDMGITLGTADPTEAIAALDREMEYLEKQLPEREQKRKITPTPEPEAEDAVGAFIGQYGQ